MSKNFSRANHRLLISLAEDLAQLRRLKPYPIKEISDIADGKDVNLFVKMEHDNAEETDPARSIKRKPANVMGIFAEEMNPNKRVWISASSGNFVEELGILATDIGKKVFAVVPPRTSSQKIETLRSLGVNVIKVSEEEYDLCSREFTVFWVRALVNKYDNIVNIDQYNSPLNPLAHLLLTAREIDEKFKDELTHIFIPLGSTGTFAGIYEYFSRFYPKTKIIGVQPTRIHHIPGVHHVMGECKWSPEIFGLADKKMIKVLTVNDESAYQALIELETKYGIHGGPSTGMIFAAVKQELNNINDGSNILLISADSSWDYREWNIRILAKLGNEIKSSEKENLNKYMEALKRRKNSKARIMTIKSIYKSTCEGEIYTLEEFEKILPRI